MVNPLDFFGAAAVFRAILNDVLAPSGEFYQPVHGDQRGFPMAWLNHAGNVGELYDKTVAALQAGAMHIQEKQERGKLTEFRKTLIDVFGYEVTKGSQNNLFVAGALAKEFKRDQNALQKAIEHLMEKAAALEVLKEGESRQQARHDGPDDVPGPAESIKLEIEAPEPQRQNVGDSQPIAQNCFQRVGDTWSLSFGSKRLSGLKDLKGMGIIAKLLQNPNPRNAIAALHLHGLTSTPVQLNKEESAAMSEGASEDPILDDEAVREYLARLEDIDVQLPNAEDSKDIGLVTSLKAEKQILLDQLESATGKSGAPRRLRGRTPEERAAQAVAKAIDRAIDNIRQHLPLLADHLKNLIKQEGNGFAYLPRGETPDWIL
jgi:hypothetical protein